MAMQAELYNKIKLIAEGIESKKGEFSLFALAMPEGAYGYDVLFAADWVSVDENAALDYVANKFQEAFKSGDILHEKINRLVPIADAKEILDIANDKKGWLTRGTQKIGNVVVENLRILRPRIQ